MLFKKHEHTLISIIIIINVHIYIIDLISKSTIFQATLWQFEPWKNPRFGQSSNSASLLPVLRVERRKCGASHWSWSLGQRICFFCKPRGSHALPTFNMKYWVNSTCTSCFFLPSNQLRFLEIVHLQPTQ